MLRHIISIFVATTFTLILLTGCGGAATDAATGDEVSFSSDEDSAPVVAASFSFEAIDDESFNSLSEEDRLYVARKLYSTLFKGRDINTLKKEITSGTFISDFLAKLSDRNVSQPDLDKIFVDDYVIGYDGRQGDRLFEKRWRIFSHIATTLYYTKLSRDYFNEWMAYTLGQTILFSPAYEVESVYRFPELIASNHERIKGDLDKGLPIRDLVYRHMVSKENWARFRSPEDNGREMLEIWLYDYNDLHVPLAAKALKSWRWVVAREQNSDGIYGYVYKFYNDENNPDEKNSEPVELFGTEITTGDDFYRAVANHPDLIPTVIDRLVALFFPTMSAEEKKSIAYEIEKSEPTTFAQIFTQILFSKKYLFESDRIKPIEEIYMGLNQTLGMEPGGTSFRYMFTDGMGGSNQYAFTYKLGRPDEGVSDTDSVIRLHQYIRTAIFLNRGGNGWDSTEIINRYKDASTVKEYLDMMFEDIVGRKMSESESEELVSIAADAGITAVGSSWSRFAVTLMTFDYFSRLSEIYTYRKIEIGGES
ncbi:hypothetical protein NNO_1718 [Hydrogenimonas sp.]|nr:hypothetical protein NNO_1718 [Hydrogenimonas sp.]